MKVLVVSSRAMRGVHGLYEYNLCKKLAQKGFDVNSVALLGDNQEYCENVVSLEHHSKIFPKRTAEIVSVSLLNYLLAKKYDIIHLNGAFWSFLPLQISIIKKISRRTWPLVLTTHAFAPEYLHPFHTSVRRFFSSFDPQFLLYGLRCSAYVMIDHIICMSNIERDYVLKEFGIKSRKVSVIPNGVDLARFTAPSYDFRRKHRIRSRFVLLYVGQLIKMKGLPYLLQALKLLISRGYDVFLVLISYTSHQNGHSPILTQAKKLQVNQNVMILSGMAEQDLVAAYRGCDAFVLPSIFDEASNTALLESMASRKPVVGTKVDGLPEMIREGFNGFIVEPRNAIELAEKISLLLDSADLRNQLGENALKLVQQEYNWDLIVERIISLYHRVTCQDKADDRN